MKFTVNDKEVRRLLTKYERNVKNSRSLMQEIGTNEKNLAQFRIRTTKQEPNGQRWQPWAPRTRRQRARRGSLAGGLLYDTGRLYRSFSVTSSRKRFEVRNTTRYGGFLQRGTRHMPARPFLGFGRDSVRDIKKIFRRRMRGR